MIYDINIKTMFKRDLCVPFIYIYQTDCNGSCPTNSVLVNQLGNNWVIFIKLLVMTL